MPESAPGDKGPIQPDWVFPPGEEPSLESRQKLVGTSTSTGGDVDPLFGPVIKHETSPEEGINEARIAVGNALAGLLERRRLSEDRGGATSEEAVPPSDPEDPAEQPDVLGDAVQQKRQALASVLAQHRDNKEAKEADLDAPPSIGDQRAELLDMLPTTQSTLGPEPSKGPSPGPSETSMLNIAPEKDNTSVLPTTEQTSDETAKKYEGPRRRRLERRRGNRHSRSSTKREVYMGALRAATDNRHDMMRTFTNKSQVDGLDKGSKINRIGREWMEQNGYTEADEGPADEGHGPSLSGKQASEVGHSRAARRERKKAQRELGRLRDRIEGPIEAEEYLRILRHRAGLAEKEDKRVRAG